MSLLLSKGGAQLLHMAYIAGKVTPYSEGKDVNHENSLLILDFCGM